MKLVLAALLLLLILTACGGRHIWVDTGFFAPQAYQWCERHREYHPVSKRMGLEKKRLTKTKVLKL